MLKLSTLRQVLAGTDEVTLKLQRDSVVKLFERNTRRLWQYRKEHVMSIYLDPMERRVNLFVDLFPISKLDKIETWSLIETDKELLVDTAYKAIADKGRIIRIDGDYWQDYIEVTVTGGYTEDQFEEQFPEVVAAMIIQCNFTQQRNSKMNVHLATQAFEKGTTAFLKPELHPQFQMVCDLHRRYC